MSTRDDLAADLIAADETYGQRAHPPWDKIADHLLAAGWRPPGVKVPDEELIAAGWSRPRVVITAAELDALPASTVAMDDSWNAWQRSGHDGDLTWSASGDSHPRASHVPALYGPLTVVWSPPAETDGPAGGQ